MALKDFRSRFSVLRTPEPAIPRLNLQPDRTRLHATSRSTTILRFIYHLKLLDWITDAHSSPAKTESSRNARSSSLFGFANLCALASLREITLDGDGSRKGAKPQRKPQ